MSSINTTLAELYARIGRPDFPNILWRAIDENIETADCDIYSYIPDMESDPFSDDGSMYNNISGIMSSHVFRWSFNYFFYNKKMKKILFLACRRVRRPELMPMDGSDSEDDMLQFSEGDDVFMDDLPAHA